MRTWTHDKRLGGLPPADDNPRRRPTDGARFCRRDRRSLAHSPIPRHRRLSGLGSQAVSVGRDYVGGISKCGDRRARTLLYEAANVMLTRYKGQLKLKDWAFAIARR
jgi:transposase